MATEVTVRYRFEDELSAQDVDDIMQELEYSAEYLISPAVDVELLEVEDA